MESRIGKESGEALTELQKARLDLIAEKLRGLPEERTQQLMDELQQEAFSLAEVAKLLGLHKESLRRAIMRGDLKAAKIGRDYRISRAELQTYWEKCGGGRLFEEERDSPQPTREEPEKGAKKNWNEMTLKELQNLDKRSMSPEEQTNLVHYMNHRVTRGER